MIAVRRSLVTESLLPNQEGASHSLRGSLLYSIQKKESLTALLNRPVEYTFVFAIASDCGICPFAHELRNQRHPSLYPQLRHILQRII